MAAQKPDVSIDILPVVYAGSHSSGSDDAVATVADGTSAGMRITLEVSPFGSFNVLF